MTVHVRFAPSPTGKLHVGNIRAALFNALLARAHGGVFLLRSDDTDQARSTKAFEDGIQNDLKWLGLEWDDFARQSERFSVYEDVAGHLKEQGLLYPCYETADELDRKRKLQRARGLPPVYDRAALELSEQEKADLEAEGRQPHWRFKLKRAEVRWDDMIRGEQAFDTGTMSDPVLIREDGAFLYTLPSCIDDVDFGITHVVRGEDHVTNTAAQIEVFQAIIDYRGDGKIPTFAHHSLLVGKDGEGLSKRLGSLAIENMREEGIEPQAITSLLARLGTSQPVEPVLAIEELAKGFSFDILGRAPARFDMEELKLLNAKILHEMPYSALESRLVELGVSEDVWNVVHGNIERLEDAADWRDIIQRAILPVIDDEDREFCRTAAEKALTVSADGEGWSVLTKALKEETGRKGKGLFMPLRKALTGKPNGPEMPDLFALIGKEKAAARLRGERA
ncbi:glutamate--tRNA ligase [Parvularcula sp. ZS-1/3]|uniref:Glutamate--tRNA ligase n=1 Tax=Parvularcula mediterranea TaxID=2732508 RepID=A0A7Y3W5S0_9PROT|nr:glutamate--tRNA ligase [Parvularcula mediterranea]NNU16566.1 glutamate--tRNA ligase [Parvularcula mediterranea]